MSMLRTSVSASSAFDPDGWDESPDAQARKALRLIAKTASLIATYHRLRTGMEMVTPNPALGHAADFLWMLHGTEPDPQDARVLDITFILYADHTMNASTFTARIVASTLADMFSAITAAIGTLKGPLHGGANEEAHEELRGGGQAGERGRLRARPPRATREDLRVRSCRVQDVDPRATILKRLSKTRANGRATRSSTRSLEAIEKADFEQKSLYPNVDFYAAAVFHVLGVPTDLMTPVFAAARMAGWTAHVREQYADNKVIRPGSRYVRPETADVGPAGGAKLDRLHARGAGEKTRLLDDRADEVVAADAQQVQARDPLDRTDPLRDVEGELDPGSLGVLTRRPPAGRRQPRGRGHRRARPGTGRS